MVSYQLGTFLIIHQGVNACVCVLTSGVLRPGRLCEKMSMI